MLDTPLWTFGDLRAALQERPSNEAWSTLTREMRRAYDAIPQEVTDVWLPYALSHLDRWRAQFRILPSHWRMMLAEEKRDHPLYAMAKTLFSDDRRLDDQMMMHLVSAPFFKGISIVYLARHKLTHAGLMTLFSSPHLGRLQRLVIRNATFDDVLMTQLIHSSCWRQMTSLRLSQCVLSDGMMASMCDAGVLDSLEALWLGFNDLTDNALWSMSLAKPTKLKRLSLVGNDITIDGVRALAQLPWIGSLRSLNLEHCGLSKRDLLEFPALNSIEYINC